ncbi:hypothetical protein ACLB2K_076809 [Fragaria x ananassa]
MLVKPAPSKITNDIPVSKSKYDFDDHDNQEYRARFPKVKRLKKGVPARTNTGLDLPEDYKQIILGRLKGKQLTLLIEKSLDDRDVKSDKSILTLPSYETLAKNFLEDIEMESLQRHTTLKVPLIDPKCLKWWKMSKEELYEPKSNWNEIVGQNGMVKGDKVQVWSLRANKDEKEDQLHLALVLVMRGENQKGDHNKSSQESDSTSEGSTVINQSEDSANARHMEIVKAESRESTEPILYLSSLVIFPDTIKPALATNHYRPSTDHYRLASSGDAELRWRISGRGTRVWFPTMKMERRWWGCVGSVPRAAKHDTAVFGWPKQHGSFAWPELVGQDKTRKVGKVVG